jgi:hypothetical protein
MMGEASGAWKRRPAAFLGSHLFVFSILSPLLPNGIALSTA